jgi:hypothetical protein
MEGDIEEALRLDDLLMVGPSETKGVLVNGLSVQFKLRQNDELVSCCADFRPRHREYLESKQDHGLWARD